MKNTDDRNRRESDRRDLWRHEQRGTIHVKREPLKDDAEWHGAAPRPVDETERSWRPKDITF